ncbi:hypothetical protein GCM10009663_53490 [Kitasatospora arboriphila]|uniref:Secreted protein n=1 Tax=Kitasatospora arboriphila TaxID=258052 RepID=A0ABN1TWX7_9ACTN
MPSATALRLSAALAAASSGGMPADAGSVMAVSRVVRWCVRRFPSGPPVVVTATLPPVDRAELGLSPP